MIPVGWRCNGVSGVRFPACKIGRSVANDSPPLRRFFGAVLPRRCAAEMDPATRYTLRCNIASIIEIFFFSLMKITLRKYTRITSGLNLVEVQARNWNLEQKTIKLNRRVKRSRFKSLKVCSYLVDTDCYKIFSILAILHRSV